MQSCSSTSASAFVRVLSVSVFATCSATPAKISVSGSAPWLSDPLVEAAALVYDAHGADGLLRFWKKGKTRCHSPSMQCAVQSIDAFSVEPLERAAFGAALSARLHAPKVSAWSQLASGVTACLLYTSDAADE